MKARFKLIGFIFCLAVLLVFTSQFQAIPAEGDKATDKKGKLENKNETKESPEIQKATISLEKSDQKEKKSDESIQEKGLEREQAREVRLNGNGKDNFRSISTESGEEYYKVIVDNNLFRPLGWRPKNNKPRYALIGTWIASNGMMAKALILEQLSNQTYYVSIGEKVGEARVESIKSDQVSLLTLSGDIKMIKSKSMQFLSGGEKGRRRGGKGEKSKSGGEAREGKDGERKRSERSSDRGNWNGGGNREEWRGAVERYRNASPEEQQKMREQFMQRMRERGGGRGRGEGRGRGGGRRGR